MFKLKIFCNDGNGNLYWEDGNGEYDTYEKALIACYKNSLEEVKELMETSDGKRWFEVNENFEITEAYAEKYEKYLDDVVYFEVATVYYDHAPYDRENDCDIEIVTGYMIVEKESEHYENLQSI